jgi:hypothetical protein
MMTDREVTQEQFETLLNDVGYLQDEAEALKYVIDQVPYTETPPDRKSILSLIKYLDYLQIHYFRPVVEKVFSENRILTLSPVSEIEKEFDDALKEGGNDDKDIYKALNRITKHRAALINLLRKIPLIDWERALKNVSGSEMSLYQFASEMVKKERGILKEIADLVLIYQNEKLNRREINQRVEQRKSDLE